MVFYLMGDSILQKIFFVRQFLAEHPGYEHKKIFSDNSNKLQELKNAAESLGLFSDKRIYELIDFDEWNKIDKDEFFRIFFPENDSLVLFVHTESIGRDLKKHPNFEKFKIMNFEKPKEWEEEKWIEFILNAGKMMGLNFSSKEALLIFHLVGSDELSLISELEKVKTFVDKHNTVEVQDIESIIYRRVTSKLDEFSFAISERRFECAKSLLAEIWDEYEGIAIVYSLAKHFIDLLNVLSHSEYKTDYVWHEIADIAKKLSIPAPRAARFVGFKFKNSRYLPVNHLQIYTTKQIKNILNKIYQIDRDAKSGGDVKLLILDFLNALNKSANINTIDKI